MIQRLLVLLILCLLACERAPISAITQPVNDRAGVLTEGDREVLASLLIAHRDATHVQIAVLLVNSTDGEPIEDFSLRAADAWGGGGRGIDDGALVVLAVADHRSRIELGRGLEAAVPDGEARRLLDAARPSLRQHDYRGALEGILNGLVARTAGVTLPDHYPPRAARHVGMSDEMIVLLIVLGVLLVIVVVVVIMRSDARSGGYSSSSSSSVFFFGGSPGGSSDSSSSNSSDWGGGGGGLDGGGSSGDW